MKMLLLTSNFLSVGKMHAIRVVLRIHLDKREDLVMLGMREGHAILVVRGRSVGRVGRSVDGRWTRHKWSRPVDPTGPLANTRQKQGFFFILENLNTCTMWRVPGPTNHALSLGPPRAAPCGAPWDSLLGVLETSLDIHLVNAPDGIHVLRRAIPVVRDKNRHVIEILDLTGQSILILDNTLAAKLAARDGDLENTIPRHAGENARLSNASKTDSVRRRVRRGYIEDLGCDDRKPLGIDLVDHLVVRVTLEQRGASRKISLRAFDQHEPEIDLGTLERSFYHSMKFDALDRNFIPDTLATIPDHILVEKTLVGLETIKITSTTRTKHDGHVIMGKPDIIARLPLSLLGLDGLEKPAHLAGQGLPLLGRGTYTYGTCTQRLGV